MVISIVIKDVVWVVHEAYKLYSLYRLYIIGH